MKHHFQSRKAIIFFLVAAIVITGGCKENVLINSRVSPSSNAINVYSKALPCITYTYYSDSAVTSTNTGGIAIYQAVGSITDPFFGTMSGATFFQVVPALPASDTFTGYSVDSAVLVLPYSGFTYGDTAAATGSNITQTYQVFYMQDTLGDPTLTNYYNNSVKPIDVAYPLSAPTTVNIYHLRDSVANVLDQNYPGLRIKLNWPVLKSHLYPAMQNISTTSTNPNLDFMTAFKGICVKVADTRQFANAIPYFRLDGTSVFSQAGIVVYYHSLSSTTVDSELHTNFSFSTQFCSHFNNIARSYSHFPVSALIQSSRTDIIALQNQPGASIDLVVPGLLSLPAGIINKAELQLTLLPQYNSVYGSSDTLFPPERLYPVGIANATYPPLTGAGIAYNIADRYPIYNTSPLTVIDGFLHSFSVSAVSQPLQTFTIDIPREVMYSIKQKNDTLHLKINGTSDFYGAFHMVAGGGSYGLNGTSDTLYRAKLIVSYSQLTN